MSDRSKLILGVTDCSKYKLYHDWVQQAAADITIIKLDGCTDGLEQLKRCDGLVLTGGEDVHPRFYHQPEYLPYCYPDDINEARDIFELEALRYTEEQGVPVLGICRGLQIANVFFGGTLIPDIPTWGRFNHGKLPDGGDKYHAVTVDTASWLHGIVKTASGVINSNHHQSVEKAGDGLVANVLSADGIVEAMERKSVTGKSFLCLLQWHPERMKDQQSPFVKNIMDAFLTATREK
ncbi:MAG TPA: gamma-glutamyl-gamma-aminobutyrate hydrolase family protein [Chitinophaga sp.]|uniref:gamma-glutamyl-gamma-aminobutyrate hydrolase family protein n=1 Tax=Chitinophaga sp. TaxID=1869181 RepID=UPI002B5F4DC6|nr:gamma-glutamyl-gamma-aminobutyrate hydrolase family protein [Chitinophaga sp.]HVI47973.1 gamma-glutamyl-gamma-aminobutyrate hydrolase family protein [Chitinophaga sp.]